MPTLEFVDRPSVDISIDNKTFSRDADVTRNKGHDQVDDG
jgi:hypothetical protein